MSFLLYRMRPADGGLEFYEPTNVKLGGGGLIQASCAKHLTEQNNTGWLLTAEEMISDQGNDPSEHALVVDTSPNRDTLNLFQIKSIAGYSYREWTPILITFETLFADAVLDLGLEPDAPVSPSDFKQRFSDKKCNRDRVRSILYLRGGFGNGGWNWGGNSRTTAALLWDDAWDFFTRR